MCNYSEFLKQEQEIKDKLEFLEKLEVRHYNDNQIMDLLGVDIEKLKALREMLQEKRAAVMAD